MSALAVLQQQHQHVHAAGVMPSAKSLHIHVWYHLDAFSGLFHLDNACCAHRALDQKRLPQRSMRKHRILTIFNCIFSQTSFKLQWKPCSQSQQGRAHDFQYHCSRQQAQKEGQHGYRHAKWI